MLHYSVHLISMITDYFDKPILAYYFLSEYHDIYGK